MDMFKIKVEETAVSSSLFERIAFYIILLSAFLTPLFFVPSNSFPFQFSKSFFVVGVVSVSFFLWAISRLKDGRFILPNNWIFTTAHLVLLSYLLSTIFSIAPSVSFIGQGAEVGTLALIVLMFVLLFLVSFLFRSKDKIFYLYLALFFSSLIIVLFHASRFLFGPSFMGFGIFNDITSNFLGKWNDLGIFFSLTTILSLITIELLALPKLFKFLVYVILVLSILSLCIVNFTTIWYVLALFTLMFFVYLISFRKSIEPVAPGETTSLEGSFMQKVSRRKGSLLIPAIILVLSAIFIIDNIRTTHPIGTYIAQKFNVSQVEVRPNWTATFSVASQALSQDPIFGIGPNLFINNWLSYKPTEVNNSDFWNSDFNTGVGLVPTFMVTTGIFGVIAWLIFLGSILWVGLKAILSPVRDRFSRYLLISSFFGAVFLWVFAFFYTPSFVIVFLTFLFTGIFVASLYQEQIIPSKTVSFADDPRVNFVSVLVLVLLLVGNVSLGYLFTNKFTGAVHFQKALASLNSQGSLDTTEKEALLAFSNGDHEVYSRLMTEVGLAKINLVLNKKDTPVETLRTEFQSAFGSALEYAKGAIAYNDSNYQNWVSLGRVYESVVPLKIDGAYDSAKSAYMEALKRNQKSPELHLVLARLEVSKGDQAKAIEEIKEALTLKNNYTEAIFLLSQIQASQGNLRDAVLSVEATASLAPNDATVFFQLGILKYNLKDYAGAVTALERAVNLIPTYANAKYFLGLSYDNLGRRADALRQFKEIQALNPDALEVSSIVKNLTAGRSALSNTTEVKPPEKRAKLPVKENQ